MTSAHTISDIAAARAALASGDIARAAALANACLAASPENVDALVLAGDIALEGERASDAAKLYDRALAHDHTHLNALSGRARAALALRDSSSALVYAQRAFELAPHDRTMFSAYGPAAIAEQDNIGVARCYAYLETIKTDDSLAMVEYWASCLSYLERHEKAALVYRSLIEVLPPNYERLTRYAEMLLRAFRPDDAKPQIDAAIKLAPSRAEAYSMRARWATQTGRLEIARDAARAAITRDPQCESAYIQLARMDAKRIAEADRAHLAAMLDSSKFPAQRRYIAGLALGMSLEAAHAHETAFEAYAKANDIAHAAARAGGRGYDPRATEAQVAATMTLFKNSIAPDYGDDGRDLIFITGMPRSGTTLLDQILASHSKATSLGEHLVMPSLNAQFMRDADAAGDKRWHVLQERAVEFRAIYRNSIEPKRNGAAVIVDKNLMNFWAVGLIRRLFPAAKIIFMKRDPMDVGLSIFRQNFLQFYNFTNSLEEIAHYQHCHDALTRYWRTVAAEATIDVQYEDMLDDLRSSVQHVLSFCGLPMEEACLQFERTERAVFTLSATQVRSGLFTSSRQRWRRYENQLAPLRTALDAPPPRFKT